MLLPRTTQYVSPSVVAFVQQLAFNFCWTRVRLLYNNYVRNECNLATTLSRVGRMFAPIANLNVSQSRKTASINASPLMRNVGVRSRSIFAERSTRRRVKLIAEANQNEQNDPARADSAGP
jgi:hypothetical protein